MKFIKGYHMRDTSPKMMAKLQEMIEKKTPLERLQMSFSAYNLAKQLVICSILQENPNISKKNLRRKVFERFYSNDFSPEKMEKILNHLDSLA